MKLIFAVVMQTAVQSSYSALGRIAAVRIRFAATRLRSYGSEVEAELRVYKKPLSAQAIASLRGVGCNISDVTVHLHTYLGGFQSVISGTDLKEESWVPFRNLSQVYRSWTQKMSQSEQETEELSFKMEVLGACNRIDAVLSAFAGSGDDHSPVLLLFSNDSTNDFQGRFRVSRITANYKSEVRRLARTSQSACQVHYHQVSSAHYSDQIHSGDTYLVNFLFPHMQINLSDYLSDIIEPLEYSLSYCAGACDSEPPPVGTRAWIISSEHQKDPAAVPPLRCVPERYRSLTVLRSDNNTVLLDTLLNFEVKSCHCV